MTNALAKINWIVCLIILVVSINLNAQISGPSAVCSGISNTYTYTGVDAGNFSYILWSPGGGRTNYPTATKNLSFTSNGTVQVQVYVVDGGVTVLDDTETLNVTVKTAGSISAPSFVCPSTSFNLTNTGATGTSFTWQWSLSGANSWSTLTTASANSTTSTSLTVKKDYRLMLTDCSTTYYSNVVTVDVYGAPTAWGTISESGATTICYNTAPTAFTNASSATSYGNDVTYQWQQKTTGSWSNISGATATTYAPGALTQTTSYQRIATWGCNGSNNGASNTITITVSPLAVGGTLSYTGGPNFCSSGTINLTLSGYTGTVAGWYYQKQSNSGGWGSWTLFSSTNSSTNSYTVTTPNGTNSNFQFYAKVTNGACVANSTTAGGTAINVYSNYGGTLTSSYATATSPYFVIEAYGVSSGNFTLTSASYAGSFSLWQSSANGGSSWSSASGTNNTLTYSFANVTSTIWYRAVLSNGTCTTFYSPTVYDSIFQSPTIALSASDTSTHSTLALGSTLTLQSANTYHNYQWIKNGVDITTANGFPTNASASSYTVTEPGLYSLRVHATNTSPAATTGSYTVYALGSQADNTNNITVTTTIRKKGVRPSTDLYKLPPSGYAQGVTYSDNLGRPTQNIAIAQSPLQKDMVQPYVYDTSKSTSYLPYVATNHTGMKKYTALSHSGYSGSDQYLFYQQTTTKVAASTAPYGQTTFENSPLGRPTEQGAPGTNWQLGSHTVKPQFHVNAASNVKIWTTAGPGSYYAAGALGISKTINENGDSVLIYTDKLGHTVLKRVGINATVQGTALTFLETYYVYDIFGNLVMQVPPKAVALLNTGSSWNSTFQSLWCFTYVYNGTQHLVQKTAPGVATIYYVYDTLGRLTLMQDGNLRASNQWSFIKYDMLGRPVLTGLYTDGTHTTLPTMQTFVAGKYASTSDTTFERRGTKLHGYTNASFPTKNADNSALSVLNVNYYDTYDFNFNGSADYSYTSKGIKGEQVQGNSFGLPTGSKKLVLGTTKWIYNYVFYDRFRRPIQVRSNNNLDTAKINFTTIGYDFEKVLAKRIDHNGGGSNQTVVIQTINYDSAGRPVQIYQSINSSAYQLVAQYSYNELGQMVDKQLHNTTGTTFVQSVDYRYNIRGWLSSINNAQLSNDGGVTNDETNDFFGMEFLYDTQDSGLGNTQSYNGNISATKWKGPGTSGLADQRSYKFTYDQTDKLLTSTFQANSGSGWTREKKTLNENISYDANGNILALSRYQNQRGLDGSDNVTSTPQAIDSLTYTYASGNQMSKVEDVVATTTGTGDFKNGYTGTTEYTYDANGNVLNDKNKGIDSVKYNVLGKVTRVKFSNGNLITYTYDASGVKLKMVTTVGGTTTSTDYAGGFVYVNSALNFFSSPEGRVLKKGSNFEYQYAIADHQGNTRVLFTSATPVAKIDTATFETAKQTTEAAKFQNYPSSGIINGVSANNHTSGGTKSQDLNGGSTAKVGVAKSYKVYPGDKLQISAWTTYSTSNHSNSIANITTALLAAFSLSPPGGGETGTASAGINSWSGAEAGGAFGGSGDTYDPKAFVTIVLFDKNYNFLDFASQQVGSSGAQITANYTVKEAGYAYLYISNENATQVDIYFDDVAMSYTPSNVLQYNEYYLFGLQVSGRSWTRDSTTNNFLYDAGNELNPTTAWYETFFRGYDPQLGRFHQVDPLTDRFGSLTPYNYSGNNPVLMNDRYGAATTSYKDDEADDNDDGENEEDPELPPVSDGSGGLSGSDGGMYGNAEDVAICPSCDPKNPGLQPFIDNPNTLYDYDSETGDVTDEHGNVWIKDPSGSGYIQMLPELVVTAQRPSPDQGPEGEGVSGAASQGDPQFNSSPNVGSQSSFPYNGVGLTLNIVGAGVQPLRSEFRSLLNVATKSSIKGVALGGKILGVAGFALTAYQFGSKIADPTQQLTTNDYMDFGVGASTFVAGLLIANPVGVAALIGVGVGYGLYTIWRDNGN